MVALRIYAKSKLPFSIVLSLYILNCESTNRCFAFNTVKLRESSVPALLNSGATEPSWSRSRETETMRTVGGGEEMLPQEEGEMGRGREGCWSLGTCSQI